MREKYIGLENCLTPMAGYIRTKTDQGQLDYNEFRAVSPVSWRARYGRRILAVSNAYSPHEMAVLTTYDTITNATASFPFPLPTFAPLVVQTIEEYDENNNDDHEFDEEEEEVEDMTEWNQGELWDNNVIQFARLLEAINLSGVTLNWIEMCRFMGVDQEHIYTLFNRAAYVWMSARDGNFNAGVTIPHIDPDEDEEQYDAMTQLLVAGDTVLDNWDTGDLAKAVRTLREALEPFRGADGQWKA